MRSSEGDIVILGISDSVGAVKWMKCGKREFLKIALSDTILSGDEIEFREQGTDTGFRSQHLIPIEKVIEAVICFYKTGGMPDWMHWWGWNPKNQRMEADVSGKQD
jgi:hypothetical protein